MSVPAEPPVRQRSARGSALWMTVGTVIVGLSGYVFLTAIGHDRFDSGVAASLTSTYLLFNIAGNGVFLAIEQETLRAVSDARARRRSARPAVLRIAVLATALAAVTIAALGIAAPTLIDRVLDGNVGLLIAVALATLGSQAVFLVRGVLGGQSRFGSYAASLIVDGGIRLAGLLLLVAAGSRSPTAYALTLPLGPIVAAVAIGGWLGVRRGRQTPMPSAADAPVDSAPAWSRLFRDLTLLLLASVLSMTIANLGPVLVRAAMPDAPAVAAGFAVAMVLTRIPLLLMLPVQAMLLPRMARAAALRDHPGLIKDIVRGTAVVAGFGSIALLGVGVVGTTVIRVLFGPMMDTTGVGILMLLTISAVLLMEIQILQPALLATGRPGGLVLSWVAGTVCFLAIMVVVPVSPMTAAVAQIAGPLVTAAVQLVVLRSAVNHAVPAAGPPGTPPSAG